MYDKNLFAYCDNNPVVRIDDDGECWVLLGALIGATVNIAVSAALQYVTTGDVNWCVALVDGLSGAISGALAVTGIGFWASVGANAVLGGVTYTAEQVVTGGEITMGGVFCSTLAGGFDGMIGGEGINAKELRRTWKSATKAMERETRRANAEYAAKQTARYAAKKAAVKSTVKIGILRYAAGSIEGALSRRGMGY